MNYLLVFFTLTTLFTSCSSNEEDNLNQNSITLNDESFPIIKGTILGVSINDSGHTAISLTSGSATKVKVLTIDVPTFTKETVANVYSFPEVNGNLLLNDHLTNYMEFDGNNAVNSTNLKNGTVTITQNSDENFSVIVDLTMKDNKVFKGTYTGNFHVMFQNQ